ncbi:hypothetical protein QZH41_012356 [Actinostola sp. cb2023]|nr:hypothetical protein QZH41_012356 [Actinostola sp. cb2023]
MADMAYQTVPPPSGASEPNAAFADALKRAKEIAARMGSAGPPNDLISSLPYQELDSGRKRPHPDEENEPQIKKLAPEGVGLIMPGQDGKDPKSIALQVAASIAQRAGLGSMTTEELRIPNKFVGLVIGRGGEQINKLQSETGARIQVAPDPPMGAMPPPDRSVTINGSTQAVEKAKQLLHKICEEGKIPDSLMSVPVVAPGEQVCEMMIPASKVGLIIGKGGETIKSLQERAQCRMVMIQDGPFQNAPEKPLRIMGDPTRCQRGKDLVTDLLTEKELEQATPTPDFMGRRTDLQGHGGVNVLEIPVPRDIVGFVIGRSGETIKRIQAESGARVQFSAEAENPSSPNRIATVQGSQEQLRQVEDTITEIIEQSRQRGGPPPKGPSPNMPGVKTVEAPVPGNKCGLIIGKGGETIRQIIQQSGAHVELNRSIPESSPTKYFVIRGTDAQIQQAQNMIREKIEDPRGGGRGRGGGGGGGNFNQK